MLWLGKLKFKPLLRIRHDTVGEENLRNCKCPAECNDKPIWYLLSIAGVAPLKNELRDSGCRQSLTAETPKAWMTMFRKKGNAAKSPTNLYRKAWVRLVCRR